MISCNQLQLAATKLSCNWFSSLSNQCQLVSSGLVDGWALRVKLANRSGSG